MRAIRAIKDTAKIVFGAAAFGMTGKTPPTAYQSMISLFSLTGGRSNDAMAKLVGATQPMQHIDAPAGVLGDLKMADVERIANELREHGYKIFSAQLSAETVDRLMEFALTRPCLPRAKDADESSSINTATTYPRSAPRAIVYDFSPALLVNHPEVQKLMVDPSIVAVAQAYVGASPVLDEVNMWWTTNGSRKADSAAAQLYHFDMDRIRWLKVFIYLTDVTDDHGPHSFVVGSHRTGAIPDALLKKGYARLTDTEINEAFGAGRTRSFTGPKGTIILEDTRGLHKGTPALVGDRLMFEMEFSSSMFGATPPLSGKINTYHSEEARNWISTRQRMYRRWLG